MLYRMRQGYPLEYPKLEVLLATATIKGANPKRWYDKTFRHYWGRLLGTQFRFEKGPRQIVFSAVAREDPEGTTLPEDLFSYLTPGW